MRLVLGHGLELLNMAPPEFESWLKLHQFDSNVIFIIIIKQYVVQLGLTLSKFCEDTNCEDENLPQETAVPVL